MVWYASQRGSQPFANRTRGQHYIKFAGNSFRISVKGLIKIAETEKKDVIGVFAFNFEILLPYWRKIVRHVTILLLLGQIYTLINQSAFNNF